MIRIEVTINEHSTPADVAKVGAWLAQLPPMPWACAEASPAAIFPKYAELEAHAAAGEAETLAKLEAENPQFGKQPLPEGATDGPLAPPSPPSAPSPAAAAPSTNAPAAPPVSSVAEVDKNGLPWDERIHASSRAKIADGTWRMKRGVQQHVVDTVEAELRGQSFQPGTIADPAAYEAAKAARTIREIQPDAPPAPPGPPAPPAAPVAGAGLTFGQLAKRVGAKITLGELTAQDLSAKMAALGFPNGLHEANARPDMWATILETLGV